MCLFKKRSNNNLQRASAYNKNPKKLISLSELNQQQQLSESTEAFYKNKNNSKENNFSQTIEFYAYDMGWLIRDKPGSEFIEYLSK